MNTMKWRKPVQMIPYFSGVFDNFFNSDFNGFLGLDESVAVPSVNVKESGTDFRIDVAVPGMNKDDLTIKVDKDVLTIKGERNDDTKNDDGSFTRKEFGYNVFHRSFNVPDSVDSSKIEAKYENGILAVTLPKLDEAKAKPEMVIKIA